MKRIAISVLAVLSLIGLTSEVARAQQFGQDLGEIFLSFSETDRVAFQDVDPFVPFEFYLMVEVTYADIGRPGDDPANGVYGWEASVSIPPEITVLARNLNPPGAINVGSGLDNWIVGIGGLVSAASTPYTVVYYTGLILLTGQQDLVLTLGPSDPSSFDVVGGPGPVPGWLDYLDIGECSDRCLRAFAQWQKRMVVNCVDEPECAECVKGDVIADGEINSADAIRALLIAVELIVPTPEELCAADMNSDGVVDAGDVVLVLQAAVGAVPAASADRTPWLSARPGESLGDVILHVEDAAGLDLVMTYDARDVRFVSASRPEAGGMILVNDEVPGELRLGFAKASTFEGDILLRFEVREAHSPLRFAKGSAYDDSGTRVPLEIERKQLFFGATDVETPPGVRGSTRLLAAAPNPFNPTTQLRFVLAEPGDAEIVIFDAAGRRVRGFHLTGLSAGEHDLTWNGRDDAGERVASGAYLVHLRAGVETDTGRILMLK